MCMCVNNGMAHTGRGRGGGGGLQARRPLMLLGKLESCLAAVQVKLEACGWNRTFPCDPHVAHDLKGHGIHLQWLQ